MESFDPCTDSTQITCEFGDFAQGLKLRRGVVCISYLMSVLLTTPVDGSCERLWYDHQCFVDAGWCKRSLHWLIDDIYVIFTHFLL